MDWPVQVLYSTEAPLRLEASIHPVDLRYGLINDADSHIMPTRPWLRSFLDPQWHYLAAKVIPDWEAELSVHAETAMRQISAYASENELFANALSGPKSGFAPGALDPAERSKVLDALSIGSQALLSTFINPHVHGRSLKPDEVEVIVAAHNRGMSDFASCDARLLPVGTISFHDPAGALKTISRCVSLGIRMLQVPVDATGPRAPTHQIFDDIWRACADKDIVVVLHIGSGELMPEVYHRTRQGLSDATDVAQETLRPKDFAVLHHGIERFLANMVIDGVFERNPALKIAILEHGASWFPSFLAQIDRVARHFRSDSKLAALSKPPSETLRSQVRVAPLFFEDVGRLTVELGPSVLMFSTDYPHFEGGNDPVGRFESSFDQAMINHSDRRRFYRGNFHDLVHL